MKRLVLPTLLASVTFLAVALPSPITQKMKAFFAEKAGEIHGVVSLPTAAGAQGLQVYLPGRVFAANLPQSGEFTLNYVPPGTYTLVVANRSGTVLHTESAIEVEPKLVTEIGTLAINPDSDGDGFDVASDCDDLNAAVYPGAPEVSDGIDNDCDGDVDEGFANWTDADSDGYPAQAGWGMPMDCDDGDPARHPGGLEVCDGIDNDCDGLVDEGFDLDGDGYTTCNGDCDDSDATRYPGASESFVNGIDDDCDGLIDDDVDQDLDGWTPAMGDCDDLDASVYMDAPEILDGKDNDCDGATDLGDNDAFGITAINPDWIPWYTSGSWYVQIEGVGFTADTKYYFGDQAALTPFQFYSQNSTRFTVVPAVVSAPGAVEVRVEKPGGYSQTWSQTFLFRPY